MGLGKLIAELMVASIGFYIVYLIYKLIRGVIKGPKKFTVDGIPIIPSNAVERPSLDEQNEEKKINVNVEKIFENKLEKELDIRDERAKHKEEKKEKLEPIYNLLKENEKYLRSNSNLPLHISLSNNGEGIIIELIENKSHLNRAGYDIFVDISNFSGAFSVSVRHYNEPAKIDHWEDAKEFNNPEDTITFIIEEIAKISSQDYNPSSTVIGIF